MGDVQELRLVLTVSDFEAAWNDRNVRMRDPEGMQLTLFTTLG
jgi:hypothetical protein